MNGTDSKNLESFLLTCTLSKESKDEITHTEFGQYTKRTLSIPLDKYETFMKLYYRDVIKSKRHHHLIERQLSHKQKGPGPLLLDIDLQFLGDCVSRQYTPKHIEDVVDLVLHLLSEIFEIDDDVSFLVVVQEKPSPRIVTKPNSTTFVKDGIHLMFCISMDGVYHQYIRSKLIETIQHMGNWQGMPIINTNGWEDVFDSAISNGTNGWLAPYSKKPDDVQPYEITMAFNVNFNSDVNVWNKIQVGNNTSSTVDLDAFYAQNYKKLFIRNPQLPTLSLEKESITAEMNFYRHQLTKPSSPAATAQRTGVGGDGGDEIYQLSVNTIRQIKNRDELEACKNIFLDNIPPHKHDLRESFEFTMTLPVAYYGPGSYSKWIKVGFALRNTNIYLLIAWVVFSAQSATFDFSQDIAVICDHWMKFIHHPESGVTKLSLMYWSKHESPEKYQAVHENTVDFYLDQSFEHLSVDQLNKTKGGSCDYDIATVVFHLKKGSFMACGIKSNSWYSFNGSYWLRDDSGTSLRNILSTEVRGLYLSKSKKLLDKANQIRLPDGDVDVENPDYLILKARTNVLIAIATRLGNTKDKDFIMRECRELFYDKDFEKKLDLNRYLMCFKNGVIDFKEKRFRKGYPEDYLSKCTQIDYEPTNLSKHAQIMEDIEEYFRKNFPIPELCQYMWNHLASILIGDTAKTQCLHYYTGIGQNGKSILVKLIQMILGDYATELDVSFFVNDRPGRGKATPELLCLVGSRFAITAEPSQGEKLNEGPMKQLTSGTDKITYRGLFKDQESFIPQIHSVIMANHYLPVKSRDHGTWRRIRVIKFLSLFVDNPVHDNPERPFQFKKEESFEDKFKIWAPVFMSMLIEKAYINQGSLPICKIVEEYSNEYRKGQDFIAEFIQDNLMPGEPTDRLRKTQVNIIFNQWYQDTYVAKMTGKNQELHDAIDKVYGPHKANGGWSGVQIKRDVKNLKNPSDSETDQDCTSILSNDV